MLIQMYFFDKILIFLTNFSKKGEFDDIQDYFENKEILAMRQIINDITSLKKVVENIKLELNK